MNKITVFAGDTFVKNFVVEVDGEVADITSADLFFTMKSQRDDTDDDVVVACTIGDGIEVTSGNDGEATLTVAADRTKNLSTATHYFWEFRVQEVSGRITTVDYGIAIIIPVLLQSLAQTAAPPSSGNSAASVFSSENVSGVDLFMGQAVSLYASGIRGANATDTSRQAIGILQGNVAATFSQRVQTEGIITISDWTLSTGAVSLVIGDTYFLDTTLGMITNAAPSGSGNIVQEIGVAVTSQSLDLTIEPPIELA